MKRYVKVTDNDNPAYILYRGYEIRYNFIHRPDCYYIIYNGKQVWFDSIEEAQDFIDDIYNME